MKIYSFIILFLCFSLANAQNYWQVVDVNKSQQEINYSLEEDKFQESLDKGEAFIPIESQLKNFKFREVSNFEEDLAKKYPEIKSYIGYQVDKPSTKIYISSSPQRIATTIVNSNNIINLKKKPNGLYASKEVQHSGKLNCLTESNSTFTTPGLHANANANHQVLRTFRIAISVNGEYTQYFGGTKAAALAAINETLSNINAVYQTELAIRFILVNNNDGIIFTDPATDPYSDAVSGTTGAWLDEVQSTISQHIGEANYDIGHLLAGEGDVGLSGCIGCIGEDGEKGRAFTAALNGKPEGARFDIDYVSHEIGHQLGANHTFSYYEGVDANFEPGSGTTIMGYAGLEGFPIDAQTHSDNYFHFISISQITENLLTKNVGTTTSINNAPPTVNAGADYTIPAGTPFKLKGMASDPNSKTLYYSWEQADNSILAEFHYALPYETTGQLFRSFPPSLNDTRYFPSLPLILDGRLNDNFESLPQVSREMNFNLIVRDKETIGQNNSDQMKVFVKKENEPFSIIKSDSLNLKPGDNFTLKWNIAKTNLPPYQVDKVNILWSLNGGKNFEVLASNEPNNGSYSFKLPYGVIGKEVYFMVEAVNNIFFAVSQKHSLGYLSKEVCKKYDFQNLPLSIPDGLANEVYGPPATSTLNVNEDFDVKSIRLFINLTHDYIGDLNITLKHPNNEQIVLYNHQCTNQPLFNTHFSDKADNISCDNITTTGIRPAQRIDALYKYSPQGNWSINISDASLQDTGTLQSASLELCKDTYQKLDIDVIDANAVLLYPNPAKDIILFTGLKNTDYQYFVYSAVGQLLFKGITNKKEINVDRLTAGIYFIVVQQGSNTHHFKLMKK